MKKTLYILLAALLTVSCSQGQSAAADDDTLFQISLLQALMSGDFDGSVTLGELKEHGDFGLGTFNAAAGEMVVLDGVVYRCLEDGSVIIPDEATTTPFANVTSFESDFSSKVEQLSSLSELEDEIVGIMRKYGVEANCLCAVKVSGHFDKIRARSLPAQEKPYPTLQQAMATSERIFEFEDVTGTLLGYFFPEYCSSFNIVGWHFHFLSSDCSRGGHVLDVASSKSGLKVEIDLTDKINILLPYGSGVFGKTDFSKDFTDAIQEVESSVKAAEDSSRDERSSEKNINFTF